MKNINKIISTFAAAIVLTLSMSAVVQAASITFPIASLGNCSSKHECKTYCDQPTNQQACIDFAKQNGLISRQEAEHEQKISQTLQQSGGPGGCTSRQACMAYCNDVIHLQECTSFAKEHGMISQEQEQEASSFQQAVADGTQMPGGCTTLQQCQNYCLQSAHVNECISFGQKSGLIPQDKIEQLKKMVSLIQSGQTPGGCKTGEECRQYCSQEDHADACAAFGQQIGALTSEQAKQLQFQMRQQFQGQPIPQCPQQGQESGIQQGQDGQTNQPGQTQCGPPLQNGQFGHMIRSGEGQQDSPDQASPCPTGQQCQNNLDQGGDNQQQDQNHPEQEMQSPEQPEQTEPSEQENKDQENPGTQIRIPLPPLPFLQQQPPAQ